MLISGYEYTIFVCFGFLYNILWVFFLFALVWGFFFSFFACLLGVLCCFGFSIFALQTEKSCKASIHNIVTFP